jgi:DNA-binding NtrC family response regulator
MSIDTTMARGATLKIRGGRVSVPGTQSEQVIDVDAIHVGRDPACHIVLEDPEVSAVHLELSAAEQGVRVRDLESLNGTFVGDLRVFEAYVTSKKLIRVGSSVIEVSADAECETPLPESTRFGPMVGVSSSMRSLFDRVHRAAQTELTVMILGETGTGKELVARAIHDASPRRDKPFVIVDCAAIPRSLAEATLLGHERGAFTGADRARSSPFVEANGGTVFLDELGELPLEVQPNLLRMLADRRVKPVGGSRYHDVDVRIIAATRQNLLAQVNAGSFRSDLYFRLAQVRVEVPALRDRKEDIPILLERIFEELGDKAAAERVPLESLERLMQHDFPGNVRELKNATTVAFALAGGDEDIDVAQYVQEALTELGGPAAVKWEKSSTVIDPYHEAKRQALDEFERKYFERLVEVVPDNISEMSRLSGLSRLHVRKHLKRHDIAVARPGQSRD